MYKIQFRRYFKIEIGWKVKLHIGLYFYGKYRVGDKITSL